MARIILNMVLMTACRKTELYSVRMKDITETKVDGVRAWRIVGRICGRDGTSKTQRGGLAMVNARPKEVFVFDMLFYDGSVNPFVDIDEYLKIVKSFRRPEDHFLSAVNYRASRREAFFRKGNLGVNTIPKYLKEPCKNLGITGEGVFDHVVMHSFKATVISQLKAAGFDDSSVALRSQHRDFRSLTAYHNLRGAMGRQQQAAIFGESISVRPVGSRSGQFKSQEKNASGDSGANAVVEVEELASASDGRPEPKRFKGSDSFYAIQNMSGQITVNVNYYGGSPRAEKND